MKSLKTVLLAIVALSLLGCSAEFWGGAAGGAVGAGAGYEYKVNKEMKRIDDALRAGEMSQTEYNIRKDQIQRMSVIK